MVWIVTANGLHAALAGAGGWLVAVARAAAPLAVAALWQGAAIAFFLGLGLKFVHRMGAAQRFAVWAAAFAVVASLPLLPLMVRNTAAAASVPLVTTGPKAWFEFDERWALGIAAIWLAASLVRALGLGVHALRLRRIWKSATPVVLDAKILELLDGVSSARRSRSRKVTEICTTHEIDRPCVIGFFAPRILIPDWLFARLTHGELEHVVLHEAEHLRRGDDWTNLAQKLALVLFPLNPALSWIEGRLCREREMACDEGVVQRTQAPRAYAACLASLAERRLELRLERSRAHALSLGAFERRPELVRRVYSILARKRAFHPIAARALVGVAGCGLLVASVEMARCPQIVAFVPAAQTASHETQLAQINAAFPQGDGDRVFAQTPAERGDSGLRAVETKAILPAGRGDSTPAEPAHTVQRQMASSDPAAPREVLLKAETPDADAGDNGQPEYVVLTAWEEVRTSPRSPGVVSDYEVEMTSQPQPGDSEKPAAKQTSGQQTVQITVTRLIFAVYLTHAGATGTRTATPATGTKPAHAEKSGQPPTPDPESGWLALQL